MKTKILQCAMVLVMLLSLQTIAFAAESETIDVFAEVPTMESSMSITITEIDGKRTESDTDDVWGSTVGSLNFGELYYDTANNVFQGQSYFAIDVGVQDNSGTNWTLSYTVPTLYPAGKPGSLSSHINTNAVKVTKVAGKDTEGSFSSMDKAGLSGGWLRIYCGITNVETTHAAGQYSGTMTITLSP